MEMEAEDRVLKLCQEYKQGITYKIIQNDNPSLDKRKLVELINKLLLQNKVDLLRKDDGDLLIKLKDPGNVVQLKGVDVEEQVVFRIIQESETQGIWAREIRTKCNLHLNTVDKIIRRLEGKKLIKSFNSVSAPKKKRYMLYDLEPDRSLTGGAWYSEQQFDSEFVDVLNQQSFKYLEKKAMKARQISGGPIAVQNASYAGSSEVLKYISELGITKVKLSIEEMESILETLVYDGKVQKCVTGVEEGCKLYKASTSFSSIPALMTIPCGVCPLIQVCGTVGEVTAAKCLYMTDWIEW